MLQVQLSSCRWRSLSWRTQSAFRLKERGSEQFGNVQVNGCVSSRTCLVQSEGLLNFLTLKQRGHSNSAGNDLTGGAGIPDGNVAACTTLPSSFVSRSSSVIPGCITWYFVLVLSFSPLAGGWILASPPKAKQNVFEEHFPFLTTFI